MKSNTKGTPNSVCKNIANIASMCLIMFLLPITNTPLRYTLMECVTLLFCYIFLLLLTNRYLKPFLIILPIYSFLCAINYWIQILYGRSLKFEDFYIWIDTNSILEISKLYIKDLWPELTLTILIVLLVVFVTFKYTYNKEDRIFKSKKYQYLFLIIFCLFTYQVIRMTDIPKTYSKYLNIFSEGKPSRKNAPITHALSHNFDYLNINHKMMKSLESQHFFLKKPPKLEISNIDIILVLNESVVDLSYIDNLKDKKYFFLDQPNKKDFKVQVFGGGTWNTQFQTLTGINLHHFIAPVQHNPYLLLDIIDNALPKFLARHGFSTHAITTLKSEWNNHREMFHKYGFKMAHSPQQTDNTRFCEADGQTFNLAQKQLDSNPHQNNFIYIETMCNHGPHKTNLDTTKFNCNNLPLDTCSQLQDYTNRLEIINDQITKLIKYVKARKKKTVLIYFGDHYPAFNNAMSIIEKYHKDPYSTSYVTISNFPINHNLIKDMKAFDMPQLIINIINDSTKTDHKN